MRVVRVVGAPCLQVVLGPTLSAWVSNLIYTLSPYNQCREELFDSLNMEMREPPCEEGKRRRSTSLVLVHLTI
jgi:hypothetical protein